MGYLPATAVTLERVHTLLSFMVAVFNGINKFDTIENILVALWLGGAWFLSLLYVASILSIPDHGWIPSFPRDANRPSSAISFAGAGGFSWPH